MSSKTSNYSKPLAGTALGSDSVELAQLIRNDFIETRFIGSAVVVDRTGAIQAKLGDPAALIYPRSALKPFQALASLRHGATLDTEQLALATGSHTGTEYHQRLAASMLSDYELDSSALQCPPSWPSSPKEVARMAAAQAPVHLNPRRIAHPCSGKHAAFLAASVAAGDPVKSYCEPGHPIQHEVDRVLEEYLQTTIARHGADGCGAPAAITSLTALARGYSQLAASVHDRTAEWTAVMVARSMLEAPDAVQSPTGFDSVVLKELQVLCKTGSEGVVAMASGDGTAVAVKMLSGSSRAAHTVAAVLLAQFSDPRPDVSALTQVLETVSPQITSAGRHVGRTRLSDEVLRVIGS
ncbi:asparaginase [Auritidibacter ignavus]|uniref:asparaginase n=1 Tax=Auritidibacter ignavus TaxID=678932 RepID=UPI002FE584F1